MHGAIILDKAEGITSHTAVLRVRRLLGEKSIGHLGTLDPFATGVLVLLLGHATRLARFYGSREKAYQGVIRFGFSTDTYDRTGKPASEDRTLSLDPDAIRDWMRKFLGTQMQQPPPVSAKKVGGVRAYRLVRRGEAPELAPVPVTLHEWEMLWLDGQRMGFRARVSSGTYIRSLAHELGERIGCGAHLEQLRRTAVGEFTESAALQYEQLEECARHGDVPLIAMEKLLPELAAVTLSSSSLRAAMHGNSIAAAASSEWIRLLDESGKLIALAQHEANECYHPVVVFPKESE